MNKYFQKTEKSGPTHGVTQTVSENQQNLKAPTFEERSIGWTLSMEGIARKAAGIVHKSVYKVPDSFCENRIQFFKPGPARNVSSPFLNYVEREWEFIVTRKLHFIWWVEVIWLQKKMKRLEN